MKITRKISVLLLVLLVCVSLVPGVYAEDAKISGETARTSKELYNGVTQTHYSLSADSVYGLQEFWTVEFDPAQSDLYFDVTGGGSYATSLKKVTTTAKGFATANPGKVPIVAMNGDLWMVTYAHARVAGKGTSYGGFSDEVVTKSLTLPRGFNIYDGEIISSSHMQLETPYEGAFYSFGITEDGIPSLGNPQVELKITDTTAGKTAKADGLNRLPANNALVMYTDKGCASNNAMPDAYEIIIDCDYDYTVAHGANIKGKITAITKPNGTKQAMKANRIILTARGTRISALDGMNVGDSVEISVAVTDKMGASAIWQTMKNAVGGHIPVIINGKSTGNTNSTKYPMSVLGIKTDGKVVMLTNDGRQSGYSVGIMISQLDELCADLGIATAFILDGGGSAEMAVLDGGEYKLVNRPSDGSERTVVNSVILSYGDDRYANVEPTTEFDFTKEETQQFLSDPVKVECSYVEGALKLAITESRNPHIMLNFAGKVNADEYKYIAVTLNPVNTDTRQDFQLGMFYCAGGVTTPSEEAYRGVKFQNDGGWQTQIVDMSEFSLWSGRIHAIELHLFDYLDKGNVGEGASIKYIKLFKTETEAQAFADAQNAAEQTTAEEQTTQTASDTTSGAVEKQGCGSKNAVIIPMALLSLASGMLFVFGFKRKF